MATAIGIEGRIKHAQHERAGHSNIFEGLDFWAPNVNIFRDPRWGRGQETYGEDPFLSARLAVAFVTGMQGDDPHYYRVISTPKHYAVHSGPEPTRHFTDVDVSKHDEEDTYLPAFRAAVVEGKAGSVMCAYNAINGEPACANQFLLQHTLRGAWDFQGYVVSDCDAVRNIFNGHHYRPTQPQASAISVIRGMDNECIDFAKVNDDHDYKPYIEAVQQGYLPESSVDTALIRLFTARIRLGMFDPPAAVPYMNIDEKQLDSPAHRELARRIANESMVLLKNDGVLPLKSAKRIAIVGPLADQTAVLLGNYNGSTSHTVSCAGRNENRVPGGKDHLRARHSISFQSGRPRARIRPDHSGWQARPQSRIQFAPQLRRQADASHLAGRVLRKSEREQCPRTGERNFRSVGAVDGLSQPNGNRRLSVGTQRRRLRSPVSRWQGDYDALGQEH